MSSRRRLLLRIGLRRIGERFGLRVGLLRLRVGFLRLRVCVVGLRGGGGHIGARFRFLVGLGGRRGQRRGVAFVRGRERPLRGARRLFHLGIGLRIGLRDGVLGLVVLVVIDRKSVV